MLWILTTEGQIPKVFQNLNQSEEILSGGLQKLGMVTTSLIHCTQSISYHMLLDTKTL